jgi:hypothetical protein
MTARSYIHVAVVVVVIDVSLFSFLRAKQVSATWVFFKKKIKTVNVRIRARNALLNIIYEVYVGACKATCSHP